MTPYIIVVTGSRDWPRRDWRRVVIDLHQAWKYAQPRPVVIRHGACPTGIDAMADAYAKIRGWKTDPHPANWRDLGRRAGPIRNAHMVNLGADLCLAFILNHSDGTTGCANLADDAGIETRRRFACACHTWTGEER